VGTSLKSARVGEGLFLVGLLPPAVPLLRIALQPVVISGTNFVSMTIDRLHVAVAEADDVGPAVPRGRGQSPLTQKAVRAARGISRRAWNGSGTA